jgi:hypothetical protein
LRQSAERLFLHSAEWVVLASDRSQIVYERDTGCCR